MTHTFEMEVAQTLYWLVVVESEEEEVEDAIDQVISSCETDQLPELEEHWTFAQQEIREAKVLSIDGERYQQ